MIKRLAVFVCFLGLLSCEREVLNPIDGNSPPVDPTVSYEQRNQYIERVYITLLGRKPTDIEHTQARLIIDLNPLDTAQRGAFVRSLQALRKADVQRWTEVRGELLEGTDTAEISRNIMSLVLLQQGAPPEQKPLYQAEIDRLSRIEYAADSLHADAYSMVELHRHAVDNLIYDDINMGTENFVVSVFDHFLYRYPTQVELAAGKRIVEGFQDVLFLQMGQGKSDFLDIFFSSAAYREGQVRYVFTNYLFREPTSSELMQFQSEFDQTNNFETLQRAMIITDEYFFL